jgi:hypothetical protein
MTGCAIISSSEKVWPLPTMPKMKPVELISMSNVKSYTNGYYLSGDYALNLADNIAELKAYTKKLEVLVGAVTEYYGDKIEEQKKLE